MTPKGTLSTVAQVMQCDRMSMYLLAKDERRGSSLILYGRASGMY